MERDEIESRIGDLILDWDGIGGEDELDQWVPYLRNVTAVFLRSFGVPVGGTDGVGVATYREVRDLGAGDYVDVAIEIIKYYEVSGVGLHVTFGLLVLREGYFQDDEYQAGAFFGDLESIAEDVRKALPVLESRLTGIEVGGMDARP